MTRGNSPGAQLELLNLLKMSRLTNYLDSLSVLKKDSKTTSSKYYGFKGCIIRVSDHVTFKATRDFLKYLFLHKYNCEPIVIALRNHDLNYCKLNYKEICAGSEIQKIKKQLKKIFQ